MNQKEKIEASKFLSLVLRHEPERIGLELDEAGWVEVDRLLSACAAHRFVIDRTGLEEIVATSDKRRFALSDDGRRIRANQGHSVKVDLGYAPSVPPALLYHGTADYRIDSIRKGGLIKGERHHVHLSAEAATATRVGQRHGKPAVLSINAKTMYERGHRFYISENGVWLGEHVPAEFINFPSFAAALPGGREDSRSPRARLARETVEICNCGSYTSPTGAAVSIASKIKEAAARTRLYGAEAIGRGALPAGQVTSISITDESTVAALHRLAKEGDEDLACLNFASAKNPGGGFLGGAEAQEESLARSSALYPCLLAAPAYYEQNRHCRTTLYLDLAIWSPRVPFIRDERGGLLEEPFTASVITSPAPNAGAIARNEPERIGDIEAALHRRTDLVLRIAAEHGVRRLVLGAWGCGVFQNDPWIVARTFAEALTGNGPFANVFPEVVFAIYDRSTKGEVRNAFATVLQPTPE
jgi:uncharacterized protein (TIGR02452 family)